MKTSLLLIIILIGSQTLFSQFNIEKPIITRTNEPRSIYTGDFDLDGDFDIIGSSEFDKHITFFENLGDGNCTAPIYISYDTTGSYAVTGGDINGDGYPDVIAASIGDKISWYRNRGDGRFTTEFIISMEVDKPLAVATADLNGDGNNDVISASADDDKIAWYENLGDGTFGEQIIVSDDVDGARNVIASDLDGDGDMDLISAGGAYLASYIYWHENMGDGTFEPKALLSDDAQAANGLYAADLEGDGDIDILFASMGDDKVGWFENLGGGSFSGEIIITDTPNGSRSILARDMDGDGDLDVVNASKYDHKIKWYENLGGGTFGTEQIVANNAFDVAAIHSADMDGDGDVDIAYASENGDRMGWYINLGGGSFDPAFDSDVRVTTSIEEPGNIVTSDVDGDGDLDVLTSSHGNNKVSWSENLGEGRFGHFIDIPHTAPFGTVYRVCVGDLDGDGDEDVMIPSSSASGNIRWFENLGGGSFSSENIIVAPGAHRRTAFAADLNGDGEIDVISSSGEEDLVWYENLGGEVFGSGNIISSECNYIRDITAYDIDADGDLDVFSASSWDDKIAWYENLGGGTFGPQIIISSETDYAENVKLADINGDDLMDVVSASYIDNKVAWYENLGDGTFGSQIVITDEPSNLKSIAVSDLDLDGDMDIVYAAATYDKIGFLENLGDGTFDTDSIISSNVDGANWVWTADFNGDGDKEVIGVSELADRVVWFENFRLNQRQLRGNFFFDENENGEKDSLEVGIPYEQIITDPENSFGLTYDNGDYVINVDAELEGPIEVFPSEIDDWGITTDSLVYNVLINDDFIFRDSLDFGISPIAEVDTVEASITGGFPRCNTVVNYWLNVKNQGTTKPSGVIELQLDEDITYIDAELLPDSIVDQSVYWHYDTLMFFANEQFRVEVEMPDFMAIGDTLTSVLLVSVDSTDEVVFNTVDSLKQLLVCAYDPNDKTATPTGTDSLGYITPSVDEIEYLVRFQNTGTDTAITVIIEDQLDENLDWSSFEFMSASHDLSIEFNYTGKLTFTFENIMLPDSNVNEIASHGYVEYRIKLKEDLPMGTEIHNTAEIYFDENPPVITNTKIHTLYSCESILSGLEEISTACYGDSLLADLPGLPSNMECSWSILGEDIQYGSHASWLFEDAGTKEVNITVSTDFCSADTVLIAEVLPEILIDDLDTFFVCYGDSVLVFDNYISETGTYHDSLIAVTGCDSVTVAHVETVMPFEGGLETVYICSGDSSLVFDSYESIAGIYYDTLSTVLGCDSILNQELIVYELPEVNFASLEDELVCLGSDLITLVGTPSGGEFSGPGISGTSFDPNTAGEGEHILVYSFEDDNGCSATDSVSISVVDCLGITGQNGNRILLYPNPFDDFTVLNFGKELTESHTVIIHNALGQEVYRNENVIGNSLEIKKSELGIGIYVLSVLNYDSEVLFNTKLIVE